MKHFISVLSVFLHKNNYGVFRSHFAQQITSICCKITTEKQEIFNKNSYKSLSRTECNHTVKLVSHYRKFYVFWCSNFHQPIYSKIKPSRNYVNTILWPRHFTSKCCAQCETCYFTSSMTHNNFHRILCLSSLILFLNYLWPLYFYES